MGHFKERLITTITANLIEWRLDGTHSIIGTISESVDEAYEDRERIIFLNVRLIHFPFSANHWPDHFLMVTPTHKYFLLLSKDQISEKNDDSLA